MLDVTKLQDAVTRLNAQVAATVGTEASAAKALIGVGDLIKAAVTEALANIATDEATKQAAIDAATSAVDATIAPLVASSGDLASAIATNAGGSGAPAAGL